MTLPSPRQVPLLVAAVSCAWVAASSATDLAHGGLLSLAISAVVAAFIGVPLAALESADREPGDRLTEALRSVGRSWASILIAAAVAPIAAHREGLVVLLCGLLLLWPLRNRAVVVANVLIALSCLTLAVSVATAGALPWALLEPHPESWREWLPGGVGRGIAVAGAGIGLWRSAEARPRAPWLAVGLVSMVMVLRVVRLGSGWELGLQADPWLTVSTVTLGLAGAAALVASSDRAGVTIAGLGATILWFAWPAAGAASIVWAALAPVPALTLTIDATRRGRRRILAFLAAIFTIGVIAWSWPGAPAAMGSAAAFALLIVAIVWIGGIVASRRPEVT